MLVQVNAKQFIERLNQLGSEKDKFNDVSMGLVFALAKEFIDLRLDEAEKTTRKSNPQSKSGRGQHYGFAGPQQKDRCRA